MQMQIIILMRIWKLTLANLSHLPISETAWLFSMETAQTGSLQWLKDVML